jgi:hypothetical protein
MEDKDIITPEGGSVSTEGKVLVELQKGHYTTLIGSREMTKPIVDRVAEKLRDESLVIDYPCNPLSESDSRAVFDYIRGQIHVPHELRSGQYPESLSSTQNMVQLLEDMAHGSDKPMVLIVRNLENFNKETGRDFVNGIRALHNSRPSDPKLENITVLLTAMDDPDTLFPPRTSTPYNISTRINV